MPMIEYFYLDFYCLVDIEWRTYISVLEFTSNAVMDLTRSYVSYNNEFELKIYEYL